MAKAVASFGFESSIATTDSAIWGNLDVPVGEMVEYRGIPTIFFHSPRLRKYGYSNGLASWLDGHARDYDLLHIHGVFAHSSFVAMRVAKKYNLPMLVRPSGELESWCMNRNRILKRTAVRMMRRYLARASFHATCRKEAQSTRREIGDVPVYVIANGVNPPLDASLLDAQRGRHGASEDKTILFLSRIDPIKGLEHLIRAVKKLRAKRSDFSLLVAGSGPVEYERRLKKISVDLGLDGCIQFCGHLDNHKKWEALKEADLFVLPSHSENFGIAVAEALYMGVPVIITKDVGISADVLEYEAGVISDREPGSLARAIDGLLTDEDRRRRMGENARRLARDRYVWNVIGNRLADYYRTLMEPIHG
ncbi:glycosyltransferase [Candidatus Parcubacteria bacterium]|nr:MAG: glycosyltransferase [Candidatus Parcubacteria bacterium]